MFVVKTHTYILLWGLKTSKHIRVFGIAIIYRREYTYMFFFQAWSYLQKKQKTRKNTKQTHLVYHSFISSKNTRKGMKHIRVLGSWIENTYLGPSTTLSTWMFGWTTMFEQTTMLQKWWTLPPSLQYTWLNFAATTWRFSLAITNNQHTIQHLWVTHGSV